ncbi:MAG TPA: xanthine dehydrogenase family protein subunit M [bacterium]|nr:xanthine dehydrogenase family protein subunit M [bacterium]
MKPASFKYAAPESVDEALGLLAEHSHDGKVLAGGQSLVPLLNMRLARPHVLIDLNRVAGLDYIREDNGTVAIGAMTRQRTVERSPMVREKLPLLWEAIQFVGHPQIRNRGTVGGSLAHADPSAELPAVAVASGATLVARSPRGERTLNAEEFFVSYLATALEPDELLTEVRFPVHGHRGTAFLEVSRRHGDYALAGVAAMVTVRDGRCEGVRLAFTGVGPVPIRIPEAEAALAGRAPTDGVFAEISGIVSARLDPDSDIHASADYRRRVSGTLAARALAAAVSRT